MKIEGGCLCGKVRYSADVEPTFVGVCHCKNCQKGTGSAFSVVVALPTPALTVQGTLETFTSRGDSGKATYRRFCPACGSALIDEAEIMPNITMILAGTLDDASWVKRARSFVTVRNHGYSSAARGAVLRKCRRCRPAEPLRKGFSTRRFGARPKRSRSRFRLPGEARRHGAADAFEAGEH